MPNNIHELSLLQIKDHNEDACHLDDQLLLLEHFEHAPARLPFRMGCNMISLCRRGKGSFVTNAKTYDFGEQDILLLSEGQVLEAYQVTDDFEGISFVTSPAFTEEVIKGVQNLSQLFLFFRANPVYHFDTEEANAFDFYFKLIRHKTKDEGNVFRKEIIISLLKAVLFEMGHKIWKEDEMKTVQYRAERVFNSFIKLVEENFRKERRVGWYAERLCISAKYLSESVKQVSQRTPNDWIDHYVMMEIKVQLKNTMKSVKEIAQEMNFPNQSFMGKYFKQHAGISPLKYRKS